MVIEYAIRVTGLLVRVRWQLMPIAAGIGDLLSACSQRFTFRVFWARIAAIMSGGGSIAF